MAAQYTLPRLHQQQIALLSNPYAQRHFFSDKLHAISRDEFPSITHGIDNHITVYATVSEGVLIGLHAMQESVLPTNINTPTESYLSPETGLSDCYTEVASILADYTDIALTENKISKNMQEMLHLIVVIEEIQRNTLGASYSSIKKRIIDFVDSDSIQQAVELTLDPDVALVASRMKSDLSSLRFSLNSMKAFIGKYSMVFRPCD
ncbi:hypothetical protein FISHEDRAFT_73917 [Fistulina hepatica ATCC 64428]|uniref:Uncharacterized protein n=1 Tax=Fistulina hepatica ATCC 64428 TaxID=1128425 RepID=A0A0D7ABV1_9AGAR|nr:hypothetical protein FISHEDRAFT_73917 [Fistulina hepatica ATCC 64428]